MISTDEALQRTLALLAPLEAETVPLTEAHGRVLAAPVEILLTQGIAGRARGRTAAASR